MERTFLSLRIHFVLIPPFFLNPVRAEESQAAADRNIAEFDLLPTENADG